jgi:hypothetical protein
LFCFSHAIKRRAHLLSSPRLCLRLRLLLLRHRRRPRAPCRSPALSSSSPGPPPATAWHRPERPQPAAATDHRPAPARTRRRHRGRGSVRDGRPRAAPATRYQHQTGRHRTRAAARRRGHQQRSGRRPPAAVRVELVAAAAEQPVRHRAGRGQPCKKITTHAFESSRAKFVYHPEEVVNDQQCGRHAAPRARVSCGSAHPTSAPRQQGLPLNAVPPLCRQAEGD